MASYQIHRKEKPSTELDTPRVHNRHRGTAPQGAVYIGRGTTYGNPYVVGEHGTRDECCDMYEKELRANPEAIAYVQKHLKGKHLLCSCKPARCHGDVLLQIANEE